MLLTRQIARRAPAWQAVLAYPLLLSSTEFLFGLVSPHGSFGAMGYSIVDLLPLLQVASIGGGVALTFCTALFPTALAMALTKPESRRSIALAGIAPLVLAAMFGWWRLSQGYQSHVRVGLLAIDSLEAVAYRDEDQAREVARAYAAQVRAMAAQRPQYVVLPEKQFGGARDASASTALLAPAAEAVDAPLVVGSTKCCPTDRV